VKDIAGGQTQARNALFPGSGEEAIQIECTTNSANWKPPGPSQ
jgi:hypothetical protein